MSKAIKKKDDGEMQFSDVAPSYVNEDSTRGQENVGMEDLTIPRLDVLQDLSPQRKKSEPEYIDGAEEGMLFNTVTNELYGQEVYFIPCYFKKEWIIWKLQSAGGGFNGAYDSEEEAKTAFSEQRLDEEFIDKDGVKICAYEIVDTANHFGLVFQSEDHVAEICVSMAKSKMKVNRGLNTLVKMAGGDRFSRVYKIKSIEDSNKAGQKFYNIKVTSLGYAPENMYKKGEKLYESMTATAPAANYGNDKEPQAQPQPVEDAPY